MSKWTIKITLDLASLFGKAAKCQSRSQNEGAQ